MLAHNSKNPQGSYDVPTGEGIVASGPTTASGDAFAIGIIVMLIVNLFQRSIGLLRGLGLASFLSDVDLGNWALTNSFLIIAVPIAVLGFPGSFGKFAEYFRTRSQLGAYVRYAACVSLVGAGIASLCILIFPEHFSWLIYSESLPTHIIVWCVVCLLTTILLSFVSELALGLRHVQVVSMMQFTQSFSFAITGVGLVATYQTWWVLLPAFAFANCLALVPGWLKISVANRNDFGNEARDQSPTANSDSSHDSSGNIQTNSGSRAGIWLRILPFAAGLLVMNLLSNLFEIGDRYMLLHLIDGHAHAGQAMVGQYHGAKILPNLMINVGVMLGGILLPYLSSDWEAGRREQVAARIRLVLKTVVLGFMGIAILTLISAPLLFEWFFEGRYELAQFVLPIALAQAIWIAMFLVTEPYMLCIERQKQLVVILAASLSLNMLLNWFLIPWCGLVGAIVATSISNVFAYALLSARLKTLGCSLGWSVVLLGSLPLALLGGPSVAMASLGFIIVLAGRSNLVLNAQEREHIQCFLDGKAQRFKLRLPPLWPAPGSTSV